MHYSTLPVSTVVGDMCMDLIDETTRRLRSGQADQALVAIDAAEGMLDAVGDHMSGRATLLRRMTSDARAQVELLLARQARVHPPSC